MREATKEEEEALQRYISSISVDTGISYFNVLDELNNNFITDVKNSVNERNWSK